MMPGVSAGEAMKRLKGRAARMVAKVLEGGLNVPDELRGTYLDAVWRGVREAGGPAVAREAELLHDQAVAASLALNLHEIGRVPRGGPSGGSGAGGGAHRGPSIPPLRG